MATLAQQLKKAKRLNEKALLKSSFKFIKSIEKLVFDANLKQLEQGENAESQVLEHKNKRYSGHYTRYTAENSQDALLPKEEGKLYNFVYSGDFIKGFTMQVFTDKVVINSKGTGSGDKQLFFDGYDSLFGLTDDNLKAVIKTRLLPFILTDIRKTINV